MDISKDTRLIIRINSQLHQWFKAYAQRTHTTMSTLVIESIENLRGSPESPAASDKQGSAQQLERADSEIQHLREQLTRRDGHIESLTQEIDRLTQVVAMSQKNIGALTEQLDDSRQMIEDMRSRSWWKRLLRRG